MSKYGLYSNEYKNVSEVPFEFNDNNEIITLIFENLKK